MTLQKILIFTKEWLPSIGVIIAGAWILINWIHIEMLRRQKERSAVSGDLLYEKARLTDSKWIVIFNSKWDNKSPLSYRINTEMSGLDVFKVESDIPIGGYDLRVNKEIFGHPVVELRPFVKLKSLLIEPNAFANFQHTAVLEAGHIYLARYKLYSLSNKGKFSRSRICICDLRLS